MFLDKVKIKIQAGNGGDGAVSFHRTKLTMNGGPDGGNGGKGGDIIFVAKNDLNTLYSFKFQKKFKAGDGERGGKQLCQGKDGEDVIIPVPCGTIIKDAETEKVLADLTKENEKVRILRGGNGGRGNNFYATPTRQAPHFSQSGERTKQFEVILELKTIADVGLVGYPNVGKSTLLSVITNARPKIANYHFTTLTPNLGVVDYFGNTFVLADIPGLIEGASEGVGLGHEFLKHVERVRLILHMIDISGFEGREPFEDYENINRELKNYSEKLASLKQIIVFTKCDLLPNDVLNEKIADFKSRLNNKDAIILTISSITRLGLDELKKTIWENIKDIPKPTPMEIELEELDKRDTSSLTITVEEDGAYRLEGGLIDNLSRGIILDDMESFAYFQKRLKQDGILDKLKEYGAKDGDTIRIKDIEFTMVD